MQTVRETEFPRIQLFMKSYTGEEDWEKSFKNIYKIHSKTIDKKLSTNIFICWR